MCVWYAELPKKKKRRKLHNKHLVLYQTIDLFCIVLDHIPLAGIDVATLIHQQLYRDIVLPLLTSLSSLVIQLPWKQILQCLCCYRNHALCNVAYTLQYHVQDYWDM